MQSPLILHHEKLGAVLEDNRIPLHYSSVEEEYWTVRRTVGLADLSYLGRLTGTGKDRVAFLNGLLTNDITKLEENGGIHSVLLNTKARVLADLYVHKLPDSLIVDSCETSAAQVKRVLDQFVITEDVKIEDSSDSTVLLTLQGPESTRCLKEILGFDANGLRPLQSRNLGPSLIIARDRTGQGGYDILLPRDEAEAVWQGFLLKGGELGLRPVGFNALEIMRLEKGSPRYGVDVDENTIVLEAGYQDAISFTKGCYMGQEVVARATHIGRVNRRLVQLQIDSKSGLVVGTRLLSDGAEVGQLTSIAFSPGIGKVVGLGYVQRDSAAEGRKLVASANGEDVPAVITRIV